MYEFQLNRQKENIMDKRSQDPKKAYVHIVIDFYFPLFVLFCIFFISSFLLNNQLLVRKSKHAPHSQSSLPESFSFFRFNSSPRELLKNFVVVFLSLCSLTLHVSFSNGSLVSISSEGSKNQNTVRNLQEKGVRKGRVKV
jgi:hypothetical protein